METIRNKHGEFMPPRPYFVDRTEQQSAPVSHARVAHVTDCGRLRWQLPADQEQARCTAEKAAIGAVLNEARTPRFMPIRPPAR